MKKQNLLILATVVLLTVLPLWLVPYLGVGGADGELFGGADDKALQAIAAVAPGYQRWFEPLLEPASDEIASLLFALQAALGAGVIGYWLGCAVTRDKLRKQGEMQEQAPHAD